MTVTDSSKDYGTNTVLLHYTGEFNEQEVIEYVNRNYPSMEGVIEHHSEPSTYMGYVNEGSIVVK